MLVDTANETFSVAYFLITNTIQKGRNNESLSETAYKWFRKYRKTFVKSLSFSVHAKCC